MSDIHTAELTRREALKLSVMSSMAVALPKFLEINLEITASDIFDDKTLNEANLSGTMHIPYVDRASSIIDFVLPGNSADVSNQLQKSINLTKDELAHAHIKWINERYNLQDNVPNENSFSQIDMSKPFKRECALIELVDHRKYIIFKSSNGTVVTQSAEEIFSTYNKHATFEILKNGVVIMTEPKQDNVWTTYAKFDGTNFKIKV